MAVGSGFYKFPTSDFFLKNSKPITHFSSVSVECFIKTEEK